MKLVELLLDLCAKWQKWEEELSRIHGLTQGMLPVLFRMDTGQSICAKELAVRIDLSISRASRLIEQMVVQGLLLRDCDPDDRRRCTLLLSPSGTDIKKSLQQELDRVQQQLESEGHFCNWEKMTQLLESLKFSLVRSHSQPQK